MPELPEVQTVVTSLQDLQKKSFISFHYHYNKVCYNFNISSIKEKIQNKTIHSITRLGKNIIFNLTNQYLVFHLRMTGYLYHATYLPKNLNYVRCYFILNDKTYLIFEDIRKFGGFYFYKNLNFLYKKIGIDPFNDNFTHLWLKKNIIKKNRQIKSLLLDQSFICGLGNIYTDEILWHSRIHPLKKASSLKIKQITSIHKNIIIILSQSIKFHGTTIQNFKFDNMKTGKYKNKLKVYGRLEQECFNCKTRLSKIKVCGRGTYFCLNCQKI